MSMRNAHELTVLKIWSNRVELRWSNDGGIPSQLTGVGSGVQGFKIQRAVNNHQIAMDVKTEEGLRAGLGVSRR